MLTYIKKKGTFVKMNQTNNKQTEVSVIIPVYNSEKHLVNCLESVITQNYNSFEIVVIYDQSIEHSFSILINYAKKIRKYQNIYINERKQGLSYAKNIGIEISSGKYITFIDSDDVVSVNYISHLVDILENNNCDISICSTVSNDEDLDKGANEKEFVMNKKEAMKEMFYGRKFGVSSWGKMYKKFLFDNIRFPVGLLYEDLLTTHKLIEKAGSIVFSERKLYCYHPFIEGSLSNTPSKNNFEQLVFSSDEVLKYTALNYKEIINSVEIRYINNLLRCLSISFFDPILYSSIKRKIKSCELKGYFFF